MTEGTKVDTTGLERAQVLCALVNHASPLGEGHLHPNARATMTYDDARATIDERRDKRNAPFAFGFEQDRYYFEDVGGRLIRVDLSDETGFNPDLYDQGAGGYGAAEAVITRLRLRIRSLGG